MVVVAALSLLAAIPASAQTGVLAFRDGCTGLLYAMRGDATDRVALPLPPLPLPTDRYSDPRVLDVTTSGPVTVVYYVGISRNVVVEGVTVSILVDYGLFAVQVNDIGGGLVPDPPVRLVLPMVAGVDPNQARRGSFSTDTAGDRFALTVPVVENEVTTAVVLMTAQVDGASSSITGLSDLVVVGNLLTIGDPNPAFPDSTGFAGFVDYSPIENSIVASVYYDLWLIHLDSDNSFLSAEKLTENTDRSAEWNPSFKPDGSSVAYSSAAISMRSGGVRQPYIHSLTLSPLTVTAVTNSKNRGPADQLHEYPVWSQDGTFIAFTAVGRDRARNSPCAGTSDIFLIPADGSANATRLTNTIGTSVEQFPKWGW